MPLKDTRSIRLLRIVRDRPRAASVNCLWSRAGGKQADRQAGRQTGRWCVQLTLPTTLYKRGYSSYGGGAIRAGGQLVRAVRVAQNELTAHCMHCGGPYHSSQPLSTSGARTAKG